MRWTTGFLQKSRAARSATRRIRGRRVPTSHQPRKEFRIMTAPTPPAPSRHRAGTVEPAPRKRVRVELCQRSGANDRVAQGGTHSRQDHPGASEQVFDQLGTTPEQRAPDQRSDEARQLDATFPPGKPSDYRIAYGLPGQDVTETPELKQFDTSARTWLSEAQFPRDVGNSLVNAIAKVAQQTQRMTATNLKPTATPNLRNWKKPMGTGIG